MGIIKTILKNILVFLLGGLAGLVVGVSLALIWINTTGYQAGLGIIALAPFMIVLFSLLGIFLGGIAAIIIYNLIKLRKKK